MKTPVIALWSPMYMTDLVDTPSLQVCVELVIKLSEKLTMKNNTVNHGGRYRKSRSLAQMSNTRDWDGDADLIKIHALFILEIAATSSNLPMFYTKNMSFMAIKESLSIHHDTPTPNG